MKKDYTGRNIEPGDKLLRPFLATFIECYALYYTKSDKLVVSCKRTEYNYVKHWAELSEHNDKQYPYYDWGDFYILEKNCELPEALKKFVRNEPT